MIKADLFVLALTDKNSDEKRALQEYDILERKLTALSLNDIKMEKVILIGKVYIEDIELHYELKGEKKIINLPRNDFYSLENLVLTNP